MISKRLWLTWLLLAITWAPGAGAQESTGGATGGSSSPSGASPAPGSAPAPSAAPGSGVGLPPTSGPAIVPSGSGAASSFGSGTPAGPAAPATSEIPGPAKPPDSGPTTFSISTGYGKAPELFVSGEGRLTRPKFLTKVSASIGFDDNIFQTPTDSKDIPDTVVRQQVTAGTAAQIVLVPVKDARPRRIGVIGPAPQGQQFRQVVIPGEDPQFEEIVIPGSSAPKRKASAISRETISFEAQTATRRTVFTLDMNVNADYYWNRKGKKSEYNGDLAIRYLHRFTPRLQLTGSLNVSYLSQPDLSQINTPTNTGNGNYLVLSSKFDLSYRWAPRFSTVASLSYNRLMFEEELRQFGDYSNTTLGLEMRYLWNPKFTGVIEGRWSQFAYPNSPTLDSKTYFGLIGVDWALSRRAAATVRVGESIRTFDEGGGKRSAPYLETTLNYQLSKASVLSWSNRFGFEEPPDANTEVLVFRSGLTVTHVFNPRLRGSLSVNAIHRNSKNDVVKTDTSEDTLDSGLSFYYTLTRKWTFNLNYNYTTVFFDPADENNYFRDRLFAGFDYAF
ncbi:MAG: hypothetical protein WCF18_25275 [Chthoniobacteraceae bacterium]